MQRRRKAPKVIPPPKTREELRREFGHVWDASQLAAEFIITSIIGDTVVVRRKDNNLVGKLRFQGKPLLYFGFEAAPTTEDQ
jgi:hypothetical protein